MKTNNETNVTNSNPDVTTNRVRAKAVIKTTAAIVGSGVAGYIAGRTAYSVYDALKERHRTKKAEDYLEHVLRIAWNKQELIAAIEEGDIYTTPHKGWVYVEITDPDRATSTIMPLFVVLEAKPDAEEITVITNSGIYYLPVHKGTVARRDLGEIMVKTNAFYNIIDLRD